MSRSSPQFSLLLSPQRPVLPQLSLQFRRLLPRRRLSSPLSRLPRSPLSRRLWLMVRAAVRMRGVATVSR